MAAVLFAIISCVRDLALRRAVDSLIALPFVIVAPWLMIVSLFQVMAYRFQTSLASIMGPPTNSHESL
jgi:hypothetical protein